MTSHAQQQILENLKAYDEFKKAKGLGLKNHKFLKYQTFTEFAPRSNRANSTSVFNLKDSMLSTRAWLSDEAAEAIKNTGTVGSNISTLPFKDTEECPIVTFKKARNPLHGLKVGDILMSGYLKDNHEVFDYVPSEAVTHYAIICSDPRRLWVNRRDDDDRVRWSSCNPHLYSRLDHTSRTCGRLAMSNLDIWVYPVLLMPMSTITMKDIMEKRVQLRDYKHGDISLKLQVFPEFRFSMFSYREDGSKAYYHHRSSYRNRIHTGEALDEDWTKVLWNNDFALFLKSYNQCLFEYFKSGGYKLDLDVHLRRYKLVFGKPVQYVKGQPLTFKSLQDGEEVMGKPLMGKYEGLSNMKLF